jgi:hypothetical protein
MDVCYNVTFFYLVAMETEPDVPRRLTQKAFIGTYPNVAGSFT